MPASYQLSVSATGAFTQCILYSDLTAVFITIASDKVNKMYVEISN